ncbi:MAG: hypothetical protein CVV49_11910 [Spirochaetae bacterium HGW-Spirochaetae-5]|nr:MAG: hypothetical protein CVV49_11910 [Spirochaetae bacterium HGW-Spirochaetae-5]
MLKKVMLLLFSLILTVSYSFAQSGSLSYNGRTGDKSLDLELKNLNFSATADKDNFIREMSASYNTSESKIAGLIENDKMNPGDIYLSFEISRLSKNDPDYVIREFKNNKRKGWGYIAQQMGIKPGSPEFKELKNKTKQKNAKMKKHKERGSDKNKEKGNGKGKNK